MNIFKIFSLFKYIDLLDHPIVKVVMEVLPIVLEMVTKDQMVKMEKVSKIVNKVYDFFPDSFRMYASEEEIIAFSNSLYDTVNKAKALVEMNG